MAALRISDLAERTGFPSSTLRYYERIGLLPAPARSAAGYRTYDDDAVARLQVIDRAKAMGIPLADIAALLGRFAEGACPPAHEHLRAAVERRLAQLRQDRARLGATEAKLARLATQLAGTDPPESCGPGCGCDLDGGADTDDALGDDGAEVGWAPIACTLPAGERPDRMADWQAAAARATGRIGIERGVRLTFPAAPDLAAQLAALASSEIGCCSFLRIALAFEPGRIVLDVSGPPEAAPVIQALLGDDQSEAMASPAAAASVPATTLPAALAKALPGAPSSASRTVSKANVEKVV
ncbi:MAG: hypothetical protein QOG64_1104 [Acidimicrobiaceae bacterium]|nr:hypothetical protein [Acidimicrobiaceae bacterium]